MAGTWTYTKRWDQQIGTTTPVGQPPKGSRGAMLLYEQTLVGGLGANNDVAVRYNDADTGVPLPNGVKRLAMVVRADAAVGGGAGDFMYLAIELRPSIASRFYSMISSAASGERFTTATVLNQMIVFNMDGDFTPSGTAYNDFSGVSPATEAVVMVVNAKRHGFPIFLASRVRTGYAFSHGVAAGGTFSCTVQMYGIFEP